MRTKFLLMFIGIQFTALLVFDVIEIVREQRDRTYVSSVCVKEDTNTTICYCGISDWGVETMEVS